MNDKFQKTLVLINQNRDEIRDIFPSGDEYYFNFRGRPFSLNKTTLYLYPRYRGPLGALADALEHGIEDPDLIAVSVSESDVTFDHQVFRELHGWIASKHLGLDDLFAEIGVD